MLPCTHWPGFGLLPTVWPGPFHSAPLHPKELIPINLFQPLCQTLPFSASPLHLPQIQPLKMASQHGMQSARDIPLIITSAASSSERRITPSWTIAQLKAKLEPVTGIPPSLQKLLLRLPNQPERAVEAADEATAQVGQWQLVDYAELHVRVRGANHAAKLFFGLCFVTQDSI